MNRPEPIEFNPKLKIDDQTQLAMRMVAVKHFRKPNRLRRALAEILAEKFPGQNIEVRHAPMIAGRAGDLSFLVCVDGLPDQGLVFARPKADGTFYGTGVAAND